MRIGFYSNQAAQIIDQATLRHFRRILALRQDLERSNVGDTLHDRTRYGTKLARQGHRLNPKLFKAVSRDVWEAYKYESEIGEILTKMCKTEHRKRQAEALPSEVPEWVREMNSSSIVNKEMVPIISHFEALLEADAKQPRPMLIYRERETLRHAFKFFLKNNKDSERFAFRVFLVLVALIAWGFYTLYLWLKGVEVKIPHKERDFSELHTSADDLE